MPRTFGAKDKKKRKVTPDRARISQLARLGKGYSSKAFNKFLKECGFEEKNYTVEQLQRVAPQIVEDLDLIAKTSMVRNILLEQYKRTGDIGLNMLNQLRELELKKMKLEMIHRENGTEHELIVDKNYLNLIDLIRKINKDFNKIGIDKVKLAKDLTDAGEDTVIDIDFEEVK